MSTDGPVHFPDELSDDDLKLRLDELTEDLSLAEIEKGDMEAAEEDTSGIEKTIKGLRDEISAIEKTLFPEKGEK